MPTSGTSSRASSSRRRREGITNDSVVSWRYPSRMAPEILPFAHIFIDHSNVWGGARAATRIKKPGVPEERARLSIQKLDLRIGGQVKGVSTKIVSGGVPPGMEVVWSEYAKSNYQTQRLFRDKQWKERGVDHTIIGHMWRLLAKHSTSPATLVLASGDGKKNEFGTSFYEVLEEILTHKKYASWKVRLASFDWNAASTGIASPTSVKMRRIVSESARGSFLNLMDYYEKIVYIQR
jgi:hypothetical protein